MKYGNGSIMNANNGYGRFALNMKRLMCLALIFILISGIAAPLQADALSLTPREISFDRIINARDLGGYKTSDGHTVRKGILIRSGEISYASDADIRKLKDEYNIKYVIDLRYPTDFRYCRDRKIRGAEYVNISAKKHAHPSKASARKRYRKLSSRSRSKLPSAAASYFGKTGRGYTYDLVNSSYSRKKYRQFFNKLLENEEGDGVLFHCICGKDRTGVAAFMTLIALGVDEETAYKEYSLTNSYLKKTVPSKYRKGRIGVREKDLRFAVRKARKKYGSLDKFLEKAYGLNAKKRDKLRRIYTE